MTKEEEDYPFPLTEIDREILSQTVEEFVCHDWPDLTRIIETNQLDTFKRRPSDLRRYIKYTADTKAEYGSVSKYLEVHRLPKSWGSPPYVPASMIPFADPSDYCILINDWPYGLAPGITHIVVWTRTAIPADPVSGWLTPKSRSLVARFIRRCFSDRYGPDEEDGSHVLWFKNPVSLQSVRQLQHVHVLVRDATPEMLHEWTGI